MKGASKLRWSFKRSGLTASCGIAIARYPMAATWTGPGDLNGLSRSEDSGDKLVFIFDVRKGSPKSSGPDRASTRAPYYHAACRRLTGLAPDRMLLRVNRLGLSGSPTSPQDPRSRRSGANEEPSKPILRVRSAQLEAGTRLDPIDLGPQVSQLLSLEMVIEVTPSPQMRRCSTPKLYMYPHVPAHCAWPRLIRCRFGTVIAGTVTNHDSRYTSNPALPDARFRTSQAYRLWLAYARRIR
jgi:hypothetical protein